LQILTNKLLKFSKTTFLFFVFVLYCRWFSGVKTKHNVCFIIYSGNGVGIDTESLILKNGLKNTENRIKAINGTITFESKLDKGFKAYLSFKR